jgi:glycosyltransferase involved in cell wall biosynthesis
MGKNVGGPAFQQTLAHLGRQFDVSLVTPEIGYVEPSAIPSGVTLRTFKHRVHGLWRSVPKIGWVTDTLAWYTFRSSAWPIVRAICADRPADLFYGYEIYGVPVAARAGQAFSVPVVARYQGTLMSSRRHQRLAEVRFRKHLAALRTPADLLIMTDDGTLGDEVLVALGHPADKIRFWMNGVDRSIAQSPVSGSSVRTELGIGTDEPVLLTVSRLSHWKRVERAIDLVAEMNRRGRAVRLMIVGTGPEESRLRELAVASGFAGRISFLGGVERDRLAGVYRAADLLLSLYDYSNLANPVIEAMSLGTPVVALDVGGTDHLVIDGTNGVLVTDTAPDRLSDLVGRLLDDATGRAKLGADAARWSAENLWDWDGRMAIEVAELSRLIGERAGR